MGTIRAMKTLDTIQKLARIGKTVTRIFLILSILFITLSIITLMAVILSDSMSVDVRNYTIGGLFRGRGDIAALDIIIYIIALSVFFIGHTYLWNSAYRYFAVEVETGTPFKEENYRNLRALGIATILFPALFEMLTLILLNFASEHVFSGSAIMEYNPLSTFSLGVMIIFVSLVCRYGAEKEAKKNA